MLQIIHDVAPKAELYFRTGYVNAYDFALGIDELVNAGCNVLVDDITYYGQPFFRDGVVAKAVDAAAANGVSYFSSAGNFSNKAYDGNFNTLPAPAGITSLNPTAVAHGFGGSDIFQQIKLAKGSYTVVLQWDDDVYSLGGNAGATKDLDIYLTEDNGNTLFGFNKSNIGRDPVEVLAFTVTEDNALTNIMIVSATGATNVRFKYVVFRGKNGFSIEQFDNKASTIVGHPNAAGAMSVGAVRYTNGTAAVEDFSSTGGTLVTTPGGLVNRNKPDFAAPNGGNNTVLGNDDVSDADLYPNFYGTSAAAPHAAASAALLMQARVKFYKPANVTVTDFFKNTFTPNDVRTLLKNTATPVTTTVSGLPTAAAGAGAINAETAIRTFGNATPIINDGGITVNDLPGGQVEVIVSGEYLNPNSTIYIGGVQQLSSTVNSTLTEVTVTIPSLVGNPSFQLYSPPQAGTNGEDGGLSDPRYLSDPAKQTVIIEAQPATKKFGEVLPDLTAKISVYKNIVDANGLAQTILTVSDYPAADQGATDLLLASLGLSDLKILSTANNISKVGKYPVSPTPTGLPDQAGNFIYLKKDNELTITQMPIRIIAYQKKEVNNPLKIWTANQGNQLPVYNG